eukprot:242388-Pleurochrysis_carterae.AAC.1
MLPRTAGAGVAFAVGFAGVRDWARRDDLAAMSQFSLSGSAGAGAEATPSSSSSPSSLSTLMLEVRERFDRRPVAGGFFWLASFLALAAALIASAAAFEAAVAAAFASSAAICSKAVR